jgi:hypothetical protein
LCVPLAGGRDGGVGVDVLEVGVVVDQAGCSRRGGWRRGGAEVRRPPLRLGSPPSSRFGGGAAEAHAGGACISSEKKLESRTRAYLYFSVFFWVYL